VSDANVDDDRPLLLDELSDKLNQFRLLRHSDQAATDQLLDELGAQGRVELDMVSELAVAHALARPDRFVEAHALAMHALEVLDRNGVRPPSQLRLGPLTPVASWFVQLVIRFIVRSHQNHVIDSIRNLYTRRLAWVPPGDPNRLLLLRARQDADRATATYKKRSGGLPTFLLGGAVVSTAAKGLQSAGDAAAGSRFGVVIAVGFTFLLLAAASWVILRGAAVARRRIRLTIERPLQALWETVGGCGRPPQDQARTFALAGIVFTAVGWLLIPLAVVLLLAVI
jgi:hypothetical protein